MPKGGVAKGVCPVADSRLWDDECLDFASTGGGVDRASEGPSVPKVPSEKVLKEGTWEAIDENTPLVIPSGAVDVERAKEALNLSKCV